MSSAVLLRGACVLTLGTRTQNHAEADVLIEDGIIAEVGSGLRSRTAEVIDASRTIVMPGFVDAHRRCWTSLFKNDSRFDGVPTGRDPSPDDVHAGTLLSLLGAVEVGVTTVVDWYDGPPTDAHIDAALRAHDEVGIRSLFVLPAGTGSEADTRWRGLVDRRRTDQPPSTMLAAGSPPIDGSNPDRIATSWSAARELGLRIHAIAGPAARGSVAELGRRGLLAADVTLSHCSSLSDEDLDAMADSGVGVALTPTSDMTTGPGAPPLQSFIDRKIRPGVGVDDEAANPGDILAQIRSAISIQHATYFDLKLAGKGGLPNLLSTRDVIRYGTVDGARAIGLADVTGSIEVGKQADVIVLRTDRPNIHPINDPIGAVVWGVDTSNLDWVFVGGHALMRDGELVADVGRVRSLAVEARARVGIGGSA